MPSIRSHGQARAASWRLRAGALGLAIAALLCCDFGPAFSPDGKSVAFLFGGPAKDSDSNDETCGLAMHDLEAHATRVVIAPGAYEVMQPAFADDGTLYVLADLERDAGEPKRRALLKVGDAGAEVLAMAEAADDDAGSWLSWKLAIRDGRAWCPWPRASREGDGTEYTLAWIDTRSGDVSFPLPEGRTFYLAYGDAGAFYLEGFEEDSTGSGDPIPPRLSVGRMEVDDSGQLTLRPLAQLAGKPSAFTPLVVGRRTLALVASQASDRDDAKGSAGEGAGAESPEEALVLLDLHGNELRRIPLPADLDKPGSCAFDQDDAHLWLVAWLDDADDDESQGEEGGRDPQQVLRIAVATGEVTTFDPVPWVSTEDAEVLGIAASPTEHRLALQVFPRKGAQGTPPDLLLLDTSVDPPAATRVTVERPR